MVLIELRTAASVKLMCI